MTSPILIMGVQIKYLLIIFKYLDDRNKYIFRPFHQALTHADYNLVTQWFWNNMFFYWLVIRVAENILEFYDKADMFLVRQFPLKSSVARVSRTGSLDQKLRVFRVHRANFWKLKMVILNYTRPGLIKLFIAAMACYINTPRWF